MIAICEFCGNNYNTFKNWYDRVNYHTCSRECKNKLTEKLHTKNCSYCNKEFHSKSHQKEKLYCSFICARKASIKRTNLICQECGTNYTVVNSRVEISKFCSDKCRVKYTGYLASLRIGELSPVYKGFNDEKRTSKSKLKSWASLIKRRDIFCNFMDQMITYKLTISSHIKKTKT